MNTLAFILAILVIFATLLSSLTSPLRTGSEETIMAALVSLGLILAVGIARSLSQPYRRNTDDHADDP